jgi:hypothetical protein
MEALQTRDLPHVRQLLSKHTGAPTPEGRAQPLLAYTVLENRFDEFKLLLEAGADPNTPLQSPVEKVFSDAVRSSSYLRHYLEEERGMTTLMLAAGLSRPEYVRTLIEKGARRGVGTSKYGLVALSFASVNENTDIMQMLIGDCPKPDQLRIAISIASQQATVYRDGVPMLTTSVSTGRPGFRTATGRFVITDKHVEHHSTIYHNASMPYFMRLNCRDFGMHEGVVPGYPASHGCIRLPGDVARRLFKEIPIGTLVTID